MTGPTVELQLAGLGGKVTGTVRVRSAEGANGRHRGEVRKLLVGRGTAVAASHGRC